MLRYTFKLFLSFSVLFIFTMPKAMGSDSFEQDTISARSKTANNQPVYVTTRLTTAKPVIDGKLDDECWTKGTWAGDYTQYIPREGAKPTYPTELNIQYDDKNIYVAFRAYEGEPDKINRRSGPRDEFEGDIVGVNFDSYRDYRTGFEFNLTAWGQKIDLILFNPENWDYNWNAVWKGKVGTEDSAWVAEMEIPLSQLRYSSKEEQVWGMHTWRWIDRLQEESNWEKQTKTGPGIMYNFGELRGISGLKKSRRLEIMPFALGSLRTVEKQPGSPFASNGRIWGGTIGLDAKIGVSSNFTIDLTVNPDFGQVESDPSVMNLTAFETFYEEKRPFFLEGLTIFDFDFDQQSLFYSRRIGHSPSYQVRGSDDLFVKSPDMTTILSSAKFSGTTSGGLSVGLVESITGNEFARISDQDGNRSSVKVEPLTNYTVARVQKGYKAGTTVIGGMLTSTNRVIKDEQLEFLPSDAVTGGLDLIHRFRDKEFYVDAKLVGSYVKGSREAIDLLQRSSARYYQRPGADYLGYDTSRTSLGGYGGKIRIGKGSKGFWRYSTGVNWLSPGLELNDMGYMRTADEIDQENELSYFVNQPVSVFRSYNITLEQFNKWNFNGTYLGSGARLSFSSGFMNQWNFSTNLIFNGRGTDTKILRGGYDMLIPSSFRASGSLRTDPSKNVIARLGYSYEKSGNNSGTGFSLEPSVTVRPFDMLRFVLSGTYENYTNDLQYVEARNYLDNFRYILGRIDQKTLGLTLRVDLNITPEFSIQYYGSPFISRGTYSDFKRITDPEAAGYDKRFSIFSDPVLQSDNSYALDENDDMIIDYTIGNPDFNFHEFRSNLVAKWEYRPGSYLYLVWSSDRSGRTSDSGASVGESYRQLRDVFPGNIFLIKLNYWFSL